MEINLYADDKSHSKSSPTLPRTELRFLEVILDNKPYSFSFDHFISMYPTDEFDYSFAQVFGASGANVMLRYRRGKYQLGGGDGLKAEAVGKPKENVNVWVNWRIDFVLANTGGYFFLLNDLLRLHLAVREV